MGFLAKSERLIEMNYNIHVSAIGDTTGKIIVFIIGFICTSYGDRIYGLVE